MKKTFKHILAATLMTLAASAAAQNLNSAYFLEGYTYGHELNPARDFNRKGYVSIPVIGNTNIAFRGNIGVKDIFYKNPNPNGSKLVSYLHPDISSKEAMDAFHNRNKLLMDMRLEVLSFGFHAFHGYNTFTLSARSNIGFNIPYELFDLTKNLSNRNYNISEFGATATAWAELGLGHSHQLNDAWRIGAKAKILVGAGYARLKMDNLRLDLSGENQWTANANATLEAGVKGFTWGDTETKEYKYKKDADGNPATYQQLDLDNADVDGGGANGFGLAFDLGAEWDLGKQDLVEGLKLSASLLDLGFIRWKDVAIAQNRGEAFVFDGFNDIKVKDGTGTKLDDQTDDIADRLSDLYSLQDGGTKSKARALGVTLNIAAEYALPTYDRLKFGFLSTSRIQGVYGWNEEKVSVTLSPCNFFEISGSAGVGTLGGNLGWVINLHPSVCSIYIGSDHCIGKFSKQWIPLRSNFDFCMGINIPFGKTRDHRTEAKRE